MPCEISRGSCSLCPYCATERCPHYHDHDDDPRYWVYIKDRKNSYLIPIFNYTEVLMDIYSVGVDFSIILLILISSIIYVIFLIYVIY